MADGPGESPQLSAPATPPGAAVRHLESHFMQQGPPAAPRLQLQAPPQLPFRLHTLESSMPRAAVWVEG